MHTRRVRELYVFDGYATTTTTLRGQDPTTIYFCYLTSPTGAQWTVSRSLSKGKIKIANIMVSLRTLNLCAWKSPTRRPPSARSTPPHPRHSVPVWTFFNTYIVRIIRVHRCVTYECAQCECVNIARDGHLHITRIHDDERRGEHNKTFFLSFFFTRLSVVHATTI